MVSREGPGDEASPRAGAPGGPQAASRGAGRTRSTLARAAALVLSLGLGTTLCVGVIVLHRGAEGPPGAGAAGGGEGDAPGARTGRDSDDGIAGGPGSDASDTGGPGDRTGGDNDDGVTVGPGSDTGDTGGPGDRPGGGETARDPASSPAPTVIEMPHVRIDRERRIVDVDAEACLREGLLELIVTTKGGKEHEACFAILAKPRQVMVGLLVIGLEPGSPGRAVRTVYGYDYVDSTGDPISVSVVRETESGRVERPVTDFVVSTVTGERMDDVDFTFAGSRVVKAEGETFFAADVDGTVVSLVSFGTEMLAYPSGASDSNESLVWEANTDVMPAVGTPVAIRLRPGRRLRHGRGPRPAPGEGDAKEGGPRE